MPGNLRDGRCLRHELIGCVYCHEYAAAAVLKAAEAAAEEHVTTTASYGGTCADRCGGLIREGDTLALTDAGWVLEDCAP